MKHLLPLFFLLLVPTACREDLSTPGPGEDTLPPEDGIVFGDAGDGGGGDDVPDTPWVPEGHARITFFVDDRANETFQDGDMRWTGSFAWNAEDNTIVSATSWLPTDGPFPPLHDDGPVNEGGHEMAGAVAGDHIFSTEVYFKADAETSFQYGVLNELDFWMWEGPNGEFTIPAGSTKTVHAEGLILAAFGTVDVKVTVDTTDLHPDFAYIQDWEAINVYLKGNMNMWTPVQILDNGPDGGKGDDVAGDGIHTYVQSLNLGLHTGLLQPGQHAQFTAMFASAEQSWAEAAEYKILLEGKQKGAKNGIKAYTRCGDGAWSPAEVLWELDSWGTTENTAVEAVCEFVPECEEDGDCDPGERCAEGLCEPWCDGDGDCPEGLLCLDHQCGEGCHDDADCGPQSLCSDGACVPKPVSSPEVGSVSPDSGPVEGGTLVTLAGADFQDGAAVTFGGAAATAVDVKGPEQLTCVTPAHAAGKVDVKLVNPDGGTTTFLKGFTYVDEAEAPLLASVEPLDGPVTGGTVVSLHGQNFLTNPAVFFGAKQASAVEFKSSVLVLATTPPGTLGAVDVRLVNSDAQEDTLEDGFTYVPNVPDWTHLLSPLAATALTGGPLPTFYAEVYEAGLTPGAGAAPGMQVELIHGPEGSDPGTWTGVAAIYDSESGNNDVWKVPGLSLSQAGLRGFTFRFSLDGAHWVLADSDGTQNGFSASLTGVLEILEPGDDLLALSVAPAFGTVLGGTTVMVTGANFSEGMTVTLGGTEADFEVLGPGSITVTTPPGAAGLADLVLSHPEDGTAALEDAFEYVLVATPTVDGDLEDWDEAFRIAENSLTSDWGPLLNALHALYVAYDDENLYVAVEGTAEVLNYILGYLDVDFGLGTGASGMTSLSDNGGNGDLDDALSSVFEVSAEGFGAEFGFGAQGGAEALPGALVPAAGWRGLSPPGDFSWLAGPVRRKPGTLEASIPLATILPAGIPAAGVRLALVVKLSNKYGGTDGMSNQCLPESAVPTEAAQVAVFTLR